VDGCRSAHAKRKSGGLDRGDQFLADERYGGALSSKPARAPTDRDAGDAGLMERNQAGVSSNELRLKQASLTTNLVRRPAPSAAVVPDLEIP